MTKLFFDERKIDNVVIPNIKDSVSAITKANAVDFTIPVGFVYSKYLENLFSSNNKTKKILNDVEQMLTQSKKNFFTIANNNIENINSIKNYKILVNHGLVKR